MADCNLARQGRSRYARVCLLRAQVSPYVCLRPILQKSGRSDTGPILAVGRILINGRKGAVYGRLSVGKGFLSICICWLVRPCIRPIGAAFHMPLAIMPFARIRSRSLARTRSARPQWVLLLRRYQPALCISSCPPFPTSSAFPRLVSIYAMAGSRYRSPLVISAQTIRAVLLASATAATFGVRLVISCTSHGRLVPFRSA